MVKIGVIDDINMYYTNDLLLTLLKIAKLTIATSYKQYQNIIDSRKDVDILLLSLNSDLNTKLIINKEKFNILILNAENNNVQSLATRLSDKDYLIVNIDNVNTLKNLKNTKAMIITCGFNSKAAITLSSVIDNNYKTIQVCIQQPFKTLNNKVIEQQEFSLNISGYESDLFRVLSAVVTILICGIPIDTIT